jgi:protein-L-isoaspartate(D-aspartate) O-methyltransferase
MLRESTTPDAPIEGSGARRASGRAHVMDIELARFNMVEQQVRTWEVLDQEILDLLFTVRREEFVPAGHRALAFADLEIPLGEGERMWTPKLEARVLQELALRPGERVLEVGTGSGYLTALMASRGAQVTSVEIVPRFLREARARLARAGIAGIELVEGDGARGFGRDRYDAIVLTGSTPLLPPEFVDQLSPGGRLFAVVGERPVMTARIVRWTAPGDVTSEDLFETVIDPLRNAAAPSRFEF